MSTDALFSILNRLPHPTAVASHVFEQLQALPQRLTEPRGLTRHLNYRLAHLIAWVLPHSLSATVYDDTRLLDATARLSGKIIEVHLPIGAAQHILRWQINTQDWLSALIEAAPPEDEHTLNANDAAVILTVRETLYDEWDAAAWAQVAEQGVLQPTDIDRLMTHIHIAGESAAAQWLQLLLTHVRPDVRNRVADVIGDAPEFYLHEGLRMGWQAHSKLHAQVQQRLAQWRVELPELAPYLPPPTLREGIALMQHKWQAVCAVPVIRPNTADGAQASAHMGERA